MEFDEGYYFGLGVFETMYVHDGRCVMAERHIERMVSSLESLGIANRISAEDLDRIVSDGELDGMVLKVCVSDKNIDISSRHFAYTEEDYRDGFMLCYSSVTRNETSFFTYIKSLQYGDNITEKRKAISLGFDEPVFLNSKGEICEGATSNIFFCREEHIFTPRMSCGLLPGIMRDRIMEKHDVTISVIRPEEVSSFDSCFITNSVFGIMPVRSLGEVSFEDMQISSELQSEYIEDMRNGL